MQRRQRIQTAWNMSTSRGFPGMLEFVRLRLCTAESLVYDMRMIMGVNGLAKLALPLQRKVVWSAWHMLTSKAVTGMPTCYMLLLKMVTSTP